MPDRTLALKTTLLFIATLTIMAGTTIAPSLPAIEQTFASTPHVGIMSRMVLTLPSVFVALFAPLAGVLADRFGRKTLLIGSILLYGISGMSGLFVDNLTGLLLGRAILGLAIGGIMTIGTALVGDYFDGAARERYLGMQQAFTLLGGVVFVMAGGLLADVHWRAPFAIYAIALLILPAAAVFLVEPVRSGYQAVNVDDGAVLVNWPLVALLGLAAFLVNALFYTVPSQLPFFLRELGIAAASNAGYAIGGFNLAAALTALTFGRLRSRFGVSSILATGLALMAAGFWLLAQAGGIASILSALAVMGFGLGVVMPSIVSTTIMMAPLQSRGRIAGIMTASIFLGHFISPLASQPWIARLGFAATYRDIGFVLVTMAGLAAVTVSIQRRMTARKLRSS
ncbi:MFS transporter [Pararhizobium polonicum]|uniref:MFS transporter n=1 Tax=Pararhizobium polonicum TaxID=1612624 RepID=A0A1C7P2S1_9HYPH|nr:MFS transporter [Pararhizobium polonicum]OBZ95539.1 MFS transporter [Pararhizobium polonicum]